MQGACGPSGACGAPDQRFYQKYVLTALTLWLCLGKMEETMKIKIEQSEIHETYRPRSEGFLRRMTTKPTPYTRYLIDLKVELTNEEKAIIHTNTILETLYSNKSTSEKASILASNSTPFNTNSQILYRKKTSKNSKLTYYQKSKMR
jgi:hypothetical protein